MKIGKKSWLVFGIFLFGLMSLVFLSKANTSTIKAEETSVSSGTVDISQYDPATVKNVATWEEFIRALADTSIAGINITSGFAVPDNPRANLTSILTGGTSSNASGTSQYVYMGVANIGRKVVIEGNNNTIDFGSIALCFYNTTGAWDFTWQNLNVYHGNIYGFTTLNDLSVANQRASKMTYANLKDVGSQMIHSPYTDVVLSGNEVSTLQQTSYTSPYRTNWQTTDEIQINFMITNLTVAENTTVTMSTLRAGNIHLLSGGSLIMKKNSTMNVTAGQNDLTGEGDASQTNLFIAGGNLSLENGANLNLNPKPNYAALSLYQANSSVNIGENAKISVTSNGHTDNSDGYNRNVIYLAASSSLMVDKKGSLDIKATGMVASNSNIIYVNGNASFTVQKQGTFSVISDSTSQTQNLLYFGSNGSTFQFADAQRVNLQRTAALAGTATTNGLINIAGSGGKLNVDIQKVSMWNRDNFSETPSNSWTPMYGMQLSYNTYTPTISSASSLTQANIDSFKSTFTTRNVQRVLYEYIPDVKISILSKATDNVNSTDSTTVSGTTNPNAYVRLSDTPAATGVANVFLPSENTVASPVTASAEPAFTDNFTVRADSSGNFSYTLPGGKRFLAGTTISAYSFLDGKTDTATQVVLDVTPPKGDPRDYHIGKGDGVPDPSGFVKNPTDTNPVPQNYTYKYAPETLAVINTLAGTVGEHEVKVILMDNALNETVITSKLIVHETTNSIDAQDITLETKVIKDMTETQLKAQILSQSGASAHKIVDGVYTDLTDKVQVTDLAGLTPSKTSGTYPVVLTVKAADSGLATDITKVVQVTVHLSEQNINVQFLDEAGNALNNVVTIKGNVGSTIDLTKEKTVTDAIASVLAKRYVLESSGRPTNETAVPVVSEESTVSYTFQGTLSIYSGPTEINFGSHEVSWKGTKDNNPTYDQPLVIWDNRNNLANWKLSVKLEGELSIPSSPTHILSGVLSYQTASDKKVLSTDAQDVLQAKHDASGQYDVSTRTWGPDKQGLRLDVPSGAVKLTGEYETTLIWRVEEAY